MEYKDIIQSLVTGQGTLYGNKLLEERSLTSFISCLKNLGVACGILLAASSSIIAGANAYEAIKTVQGMEQISKDLNIQKQNEQEIFLTENGVKKNNDYKNVEEYSYIK
jgi:NifU-like protein involved in Fe-S cluster formation